MRFGVMPVCYAVKGWDFMRKKAAYAEGDNGSFVVCKMLICTAAALWGVGVLIFFAVNSGVKNVVGLNSAFTAIVGALGLAAGACGLFASRRLAGKRRALLMIPPVLCAIIYFITVPYSPSHDGYDLGAFAEQLYNLGHFVEYANGYLSFTPSNRLIVYIYYPFMILFGNIEAGARFVNIVCVLGAMFMTARAAKNMFGGGAFYTGLYVFTAFLPFPLLSAPYIYPIVIFLLSASLMMLSSSGKVEKAAGYIVSGVLFLIRPTAFGAVLVYLLFHNIFMEKQKGRLLKNIISVAAALAVGLVVKTAAGHVLYANDLYPYPNLNSTASLWSLELGTRMQGEETGLCTYSGYDNEGFDEISSDFHKIWDIRVEGDSSDAGELDTIQSELRSKIISRFFKETLSSPQTVWEFLSTKYFNYYKDGYKSYYATVNLTDSNAADMLYKNYEDRFYLYENAVLILFYGTAAAVSIAAVVALGKRNHTGKGMSAAVSMILAAIAVAAVSILFAEVGKRLMFDILIPMLLCIVYAADKVVSAAEEKLADKKGVSHFKTGVAALAAVMLSLITAGLYNQLNHDMFRNVRIYSDEENITLKLDGVYDMSDAYVYMYDGEDIPCGVTDRITIPVKENNVEYAQLIFKDTNDEIRLSKLRIRNFAG